jgi:hypothetical protein
MRAVSALLQVADRVERAAAEYYRGALVAPITACGGAASGLVISAGAGVSSPSMVMLGALGLAVVAGAAELGRRVSAASAPVVLQAKPLARHMAGDVRAMPALERSIITRQRAELDALRSAIGARDEIGKLARSREEGGRDV